MTPAPQKNRSASSLIALKLGNLRNVTLLFLAVLCLAAAATAKPVLRFNAGRTFKIVQFCDIQDNHDLDPRTSAAMERILDAERPDLAVLAGDTVDTGACASRRDLRKAIDKVVQPMESRHIPWVNLMGNHDIDGLHRIGVDKRQMMAMFRRYPRNVNPPDPIGVDGVGNGLLEILGSVEDKLAFGVWLLDSNAYGPDQIGGQPLGGYDWIHTSQVVWYYVTSRAVEKTLGRKLPALMFFHVCLPEFVELAVSGKIAGERNEPECPGPINGGMFAAVLERGDVQGIYVGHDHTNTYEGTWLGVRFGFGGSIGYGAYGLDSEDEGVRNRIRGARVFVIDEGNPRAYKSRYVYAHKL